MLASLNVRSYHFKKGGIIIVSIRPQQNYSTFTWIGQIRSTIPWSYPRL